MRKLIHSNFELDLQNYKLVDTENNADFADTQFAKTTYPFEIDLVDDLDIAFGFISAYTTSPQTLYDCIYCHNDTIEKAVFEITELTGRKLSCSIQFGLENFPSWDKKLSELNLLDFDLPPGADIYSHAETIILQTYPAVNYNFPQVHTDKYDTTQEEWIHFDKILNNRKSGAFLINEIDPVAVISYNRNIMAPMPYLMYVLKKGVEDANFTLDGDILTDEILADKLICSSNDYFYKNIGLKYDCLIYASEYVLYIHPVTGYFYRTLIKGFSIENGFYSFFGSIMNGYNQNSYGGVSIVVNNVLIYTSPAGSLLNAPFDVDLFVIANQNNSNLVEIVVTSFLDSPLSEDSVTVDLEFNRLSELDSNNQPLPFIVNKNKINLKKSLPDITYGELVNIIKNWFNYNFNIEGSVVYMNKISVAKNFTNSFSLENLEIKEPTRSFKTGISFLHKFASVDNAQFKFKEVFQNYIGTATENFKVDAKTNVIEVNALPFPQFFRNEANTAYDFEGSESKLYLVKYDGLTGVNNFTKPSDNLLLDAIHAKYWFEWFKFRINSTGFKWRFKAFGININQLFAKSTVFAYSKFHLIKSIQRTEIAPDLFEIEIDTDSV